MLAALVLGYDVAGAARAWRSPRGRSRTRTDRPSLLAAAAAGRAPARPRRAGRQPRHAHRDDAAADAELHQRGRRRDDAQRRGRHERLRRRARARSRARGLRSAGRRDRRSARQAGRRRLQARRPRRRAGHALGDHAATISASTRAATRSIPRSIACRQALAELRPKPDEIERIDVATYRFASVMRNPDPPNYFASKYSLPHAAAVMVVQRQARATATVDDAALARSRRRRAAPPRARDAKTRR